MDHTNANGLVDGCIPAGKPCPFSVGCLHLNKSRCPTEERLNEHAFSCAAARFFSICLLSKART